MQKTTEKQAVLSSCSSSVYLLNQSDKSSQSPLDSPLPTDYSWDMIAKKIQLEIDRLTQRKNELARELEIVASNLSVLHKVSENGHEPPPPTLSVATVSVMQAMKRFSRTELAERIRHTYPDLEFNEGSVVKPIKKAMSDQKVRLVQESRGNKQQAIYEWVESSAK
jgi:hypothetical protein